MFAIEIDGTPKYFIDPKDGNAVIESIQNQMKKLKETGNKANLEGLKKAEVTKHIKPEQRNALSVLAVVGFMALIILSVASFILGCAVNPFFAIGLVPAGIFVIAMPIYLLATRGYVYYS